MTTNDTSATDAGTELATVTRANESPAGSVSFSVTLGNKQLANFFLALFSGACTLAVVYALHYVGSIFVGAVPYILGVVLFATIVTAFFTLLGVQKQMRRSAGLRVNFTDAYTAVSVFVAMGFFATASMHAFLADGHAMDLWNKGLWAAGLAVVGHGFARGLVSLWNEGKAKN